MSSQEQQEKQVEYKSMSASQEQDKKSWDKDSSNSLPNFSTTSMFKYNASHGDLAYYIAMQACQWKDINRMIDKIYKTLNPKSIFRKYRIFRTIHFASVLLGIGFPFLIMGSVDIWSNTNDLSKIHINSIYYLFIGIVLSLVGLFCSTIADLDISKMQDDIENLKYKTDQIESYNDKDKCIIVHESIIKS